MSEEKQTATVSSIDFASLLSEAHSGYDQYHAYQVEHNLLGIFKETLNAALKKRENALHFSFPANDSEAPTIDLESHIFRDAVESIESLPWIASVEKRKSDGIPRLNVYLQNPETGHPLFPDTIKNWDKIHYPVLVEEKRLQDEAESAELARQFDGTVARQNSFIGKLIGRLKPKEAPALSAPKAERKILAAPTLGDQFNEQAANLRNAIGRFETIDIDRARMERLLQQIKTMLNEDNTHTIASVIQRSYLRRTKHDVALLAETFTEYADTLDLANTGSSQKLTLPQDKLDSLKSHFDKVMDTLESSVQKVLKTKMDQADIGREVHSMRIGQIEKLDTIDVIAPGQFSPDRG